MNHNSFASFNCRVISAIIQELFYTTLPLIGRSRVQQRKIKDWLGEGDTIMKPTVNSNYPTASKGLQARCRGSHTCFLLAMVFKGLLFLNMDIPFNHHIWEPLVKLSFMNLSNCISMTTEKSVNTVKVNSTSFNTFSPVFLLENKK